MHLSRLSLLATAALLACAQAYAFDVTVIPGPTSNGAWAGSTFTPTAAGATVNAGEVQALLASGAVTVQSTGGDALAVRAPITWGGQRAHAGGGRQPGRAGAARRHGLCRAGAALWAGCGGSGQHGGLPGQRACQPARHGQLPDTAGQRRRGARLHHPHRAGRRGQYHGHGFAGHERRPGAQLRAGCGHRRQRHGELGRRLWADCAQHHPHRRLHGPLRRAGPCDRPAHHRPAQRQLRGPVRQLTRWRVGEPGPHARQRGGGA